MARFYIDNGEGFARSFETIEQAERVARNHTAKHGFEVSIFDREDTRNFSYSPRFAKNPKGRLVATTIRDALNRIWTDVNALPGSSDPVLL